MDAMDTVLELSNEQTRIVPAYGPVMTKAEFKAERDMMEEVRARLFKQVREGDGPKDMLEGGVLKGLARTWKDPYKFLYDACQGSAGLTMTNWTPMSFRRKSVKRSILAVFCVVAAAAPVLGAELSKDSLADLIQAGNRKAALDKIRAGADVNAAQPDGTRPIHWAVYRVDYELLDALIAKKAKVDVTNEFGSTPLAEAVKLADARMVKTLLDAGAGPESANLDGETALMLAIKTGESAHRRDADQSRRQCKRGREVSQSNAVDVCRRRGQKCGRDGEAAAFQRCQRQAPGAVQRLAEPDYVGAPRAVSSRRGTDRNAVCGTRRLL